MNGLASIRHANKRFDLTRTGRALQSRAKGAQVKRKHVSVSGSRHREDDAVHPRSRAVTRFRC
jgi:hypothetical protein